MFSIVSSENSSFSPSPILPLDQGCPSGSYTAAMRPDATSPIPSPFLGLPEAEWLCANELAFAIFDSFPVSPGHVLVITRRVVPTYFECTAAEQAAVMQLVGELKRLLDERLDPKPDGYNVGFNAGAAAGQTVPHVHVHVIPRYAGDMGDPRGGVRHVIPGKGNYLVAEKGDSHLLPVAEGDTAPAEGRGLETKGGCHLFGSRSPLGPTGRSGRGWPSGCRGRARSTCSRRSSSPRGSTSSAPGFSVRSPPGPACDCSWAITSASRLPRRCGSCWGGWNSPAARSRPGSRRRKTSAARPIRFTRRRGGSRIRRAGSWSWGRATSRGRPWSRAWSGTCSARRRARANSTANSPPRSTTSGSRPRRCRPRWSSGMRRLFGKKVTATICRSPQATRPRPRAGVSRKWWPSPFSSPPLAAGSPRLPRRDPPRWLLKSPRRRGHGPWENLARGVRRARRGPRTRPAAAGARDRPPGRDPRAGRGHAPAGDRPRERVVRRRVVVRLLRPARHRLDPKAFPPRQSRGPRGGGPV